MADAPTTIDRKRRRKVWLVLLLILLVPVLLVGGALLYLRTEAGGALLKAKVLAAVGDALAGKVEAEGLTLDGGHLVLTGVKLYTPEGELVASIARVEADVDLPALAGQRVHLTRAQVQEPKLLLKQDARGWNLLRAIAAKTKSEPSTGPATKNAWRVELQSLELVDGLFDLEQDTRRITATKLHVSGDAKVKLDPLEVTGSLKLESALTSPLEEQLVAAITANTTGGPQSYDVSVTLGQTRLRGKVELPALALTIDELVAAPREVKAFVPAYPVLQTVYAKGSVSPKQATLQVSAGKAHVTAEAKYDLDTNAAERIALRGSDVDLKELVGAEQASDLGFEASGSLSDWRPASLSGAVKATAFWDAKPERLASATLDATAKAGEATLTRLEVLVPGAKLVTRGTASMEQLKLFSTLEATDLHKLDSTLIRFAHVDTGGLSGSGTLRVSVTGPTTHPAAKALGRLKSLALAGVQIEQLDVDADVPDVTQPLDTDIMLHAKRVRVGDRAFDEVTFDFYTHGRDIDLDLTTKGLGDLQAHFIGTLDRDRLGADIFSAELKWSDSVWVLEAPITMQWAKGFKIFPFSLHEGTQRTTGRFELMRDTLDAEVHSERLDLARLPKIISPPAWELGGTLDSVDVTATGQLSALTVALTAKLHDGTIFGVSGLALDLQGAWKNQHAVGTLKLASTLGQLDGTFDLPILALLDETPGDARAHFAFEGVSVDALAAQLKREVPVHGTLSGTLDVGGSGDRPLITAQVKSAALEVVRPERPKLVLTDVGLTVATAADKTLGAKLVLSTLGGTHTLGLTTPLTLSSLRHAPPDREALLAMPVTVDLDVQTVQLRPLAEALGVRDDELAGTTSGKGQLTGTARAPVGELVFSLSKANYPPLQAADVKLTLTADANRTRVVGTGALSEKPALEFSASVGAPPARALAALLAEGGTIDAAIDAVKNAPLETLVVVQPFDLGVAFPSKEGAPAPGGAVSATFEAKGTLENPNGRLFGTLTNLRFDRVSLGSARFDLRSTGVEQTFTVALGGQGRDDFKAKGTTGLDVRLSALRKGLTWRQAPLDVTLDSRNFDLGFLSGSTELLRAVAGRLDLQGHVGGTLGSPNFVGDAKLTGGRVAIAGQGDYRDLELELHATNDLVDLKHFSTTSGGGKAELVARAERQPSGAFLLKSTGSAEKFPIVNDDQLLANLSLKYELEGDVTTSLVDVKRLAIPRVDVQLPEVKRKDLQDLQRPKDIIVLRNGARPTQRKRQAAKDGTAPQQSSGFVIRALIDAPRNLWVRSSDLNVELGLSEGFRVEVNDGVRLFGEARLNQGTINVIGREFTVQKGSEARFAGLATQPYVNVNALHTNTREQVKITVTVAGRYPDISIKATSEPPMPESDIYAILATGRRTLKNSGSASISPGQAASVVGQLAASQLKTVIARKLPLDLFNFETSDDFQRVKLDIGWYLTDTLFLGGSVHVGAQRDRGENVFSSRLEYQMTKGVTLEAYAGDAPSFGADAVWSRDF